VVLGLLLAPLYNPVWTRAICSPADFRLGLVAFALLILEMALLGWQLY